MDILSNKYKFSDFTLNNYKKILKIAKQNYEFSFFNKKSNRRKNIILRHDIEFSVKIAEKMSIIENDLGIHSTYFLQLHSDFYNPLDIDNYNSINNIIDSGHQLGLHFDSHFWGVADEKKLEKYLLIDKSTLEKYFNVDIKVFSFHNTSDFILSCEKDKYAGMLNVYSNYFKNEFSYCTDSTGYWRYERLKDVVKKAKYDKMQILIHDGMWQNEILPPRRRIYKVIDDRASKSKKLYDYTIKKFGAKNIDWDEVL